MITEKGKSVLGKYLAGQNDSTFSYIALGVGPVPAFDPIEAGYSTTDVTNQPIGKWVRTNGDTDTEYSAWSYVKFNGTDGTGTANIVPQGFVPEYTKISHDDGYTKFSNHKELDYEVIRVPISEAGIEYVKSEGDDRYYTDLVFTATVPSFDEYKFTEIGVFSAVENAILDSSPSQQMFRFAPEELWNGPTATALSSEVIESATNDPSKTKYYPTNSEEFASYYSRPAGATSTGHHIYGEPRTGSYCLALNTEINVSAKQFILGQVRPDDQFRLAYFLNPSSTTGDLSKSVTIKFSTGGTSPSDIKSAEVDLVTNTEYFKSTGVADGIPTCALLSQKYAVATASVKDFNLQTGFDWGSVNKITLSSTSGAPKVMLDSLQFVLLTTTIPTTVLPIVLQNRNELLPADFDGFQVEDFSL